MIRKWLKVCHVQQIIHFNLKHVSHRQGNLIYLKKIKHLLFLVPNDEDGDTVFMPIKSNDDDEPVRNEEQKRYQ